MPFKKTEFTGLMIFEPVVFEDSRGYFFESYNADIFRQQAGLDIHFVQDNQSSSSYGVIRGLHYQLNPHAQTKLVRVLTGKIRDVVVDIRKGSPTFGRHMSIELSAENKLQILIPRGFAHGFAVLSDHAEVFYKCDGLYHRESEAGILYSDPELMIDWGIPAEKEIISEKDRSHPGFGDHRSNFQF